MDVLYECDRTRCVEKCNYPLCMHTSDVSHAANFERSEIADKYIENSWIPIEAGCQMPDLGEEVQVTLWIDNTVKGVPGEVYAVDNATYTGKQYYIPDATGESGFTTVTDWIGIESSGVIAVAWRKKPLPYICDQAGSEHCRKVWEAFKHA